LVDIFCPNKGGQRKSCESVRNGEKKKKREECPEFSSLPPGKNRGVSAGKEGGGGRREEKKAWILRGRESREERQYPRPPKRIRPRFGPGEKGGKRPSLMLEDYLRGKKGRLRFVGKGRKGRSTLLFGIRDWARFLLEEGKKDEACGGKKGRFLLPPISPPLQLRPKTPSSREGNRYFCQEEEGGETAGVRLLYGLRRGGG